VILPGKHGQSYHIDEPNMYYMPVDLWGNMRGLTTNIGIFYHMESNPLNLLGIALICLLIFIPTERGIRDDLIQDMPSPWDVCITSSPWT
jgi:hypothetical protein